MIDREIDVDINVDSFGGRQLWHVSCMLRNKQSRAVCSGHHGRASHQHLWTPWHHWWCHSGDPVFWSLTPNSAIPASSIWTPALLIWPPAPSPGGHMGSPVLGYGFPKTCVQMLMCSVRVSWPGWAFVSVLVPTHPGPSHPHLLDCFVLSFLHPFPRLLFPSFSSPSPPHFSLSSLLSPLNTLYPSFGQNFRVRSLGPTCCFPWVGNLVLAVWSPSVWSDPLESQNPESQHLAVVLVFAGLIGQLVVLIFTTDFHSLPIGCTN